MGGACLWSWELTISWLDLAKIMVRSFYPRNIVVVCVIYSLACRSVALHYCGTCVLAFWSCAQLCITNLPKNGLCMVLVVCLLSWMFICQAQLGCMCKIVPCVM